MAHGLNAMLKRGTNTLGCKSDGKTGIGSRRIFAPQFKLQVLDSYRNDADCKGNQRATARKYGIHRRQIQKWLQVENNLRNSVIKNKSNELIVSPEARKCGIELALRSADHRQRDDDVCSEVVYSRRQRQVETEAELEHGTALRIGGPEVRDVTAVDKRVPDIPQQHSPSLQLQQQTVPSAAVSVSIPLPSSYNNTTLHHEWQSSRSPDTCSSSDFSHASPQPPPLAYHPTSPAATPFKCECPEASSSLLSLPLDFTTHSRRTTLDDSPRGAITPTTVPQIPSPIVYTTLNSSESAAPMDLSLKKPYMPLLYPRTDLHAPVPLVLCPNNNNTTPPPPLHNPYTTATLSPILITDPQIWDLSTKGIKRQHDEISPCVSSSSEDTTSNRPVKLFKPYLDIIEDDEYRNQHEPDVKPIIVSSVDHYSDNEQHFIYNNNNNNNNDFKMDYTFYKDETHPMDARNFYYHPMGSDYYPNGGLHFISAAHYDEHRNSFVFNKTNHHPNAIKQRQSYSLDFKLNAIECYYSDAVCRGNQRAVASKFKIHRRQVQKWLKQEQQLRQRNETTKPMHIVR